MFDSLDFIKPYLRGWYIIIGAMVLSFLAARKYLDYVAPVYESTAKLRLADLNEGIPNSNLFKDLDIFATTQKINAEIELLKSHKLISKALSKLPFGIQIFRSGNIRESELFDDSPIKIHLVDWQAEQLDKTYQLVVHEDTTYTLRINDENAIKAHFGETVHIENSALCIELNHEIFLSKENIQVADQYTFSVLSQTKLISQILSNLDVIAVDKDVPVIRISYKSQHPKKAALFPNALADTYIEDYIENKYSAAYVTVAFLDERIAEVGKKLEMAEQKILDYRVDQEITNIRQETETGLRQMSQLEIQETNLKMSLEAIKDLENYIQSGKDNFLELAPNFEAFTDLLSTEIIKKIKQLQGEKKDLLIEYTEKDERVIAVDAKIQDLTSYLEESITNTRKNLQVKYDKLVEKIANYQDRFEYVPEKERVMTILQREFEIYQKSYNFLNQKKIEAEIAKAAKIAFHRIITPASVSRAPVSPNRIIIKVVATILGMFGAILLIFIVHSLKARVNGLNTVQENSMIPVLVSVPKLKNQPEKDSFFVKAVCSWEVKKVLQPNGITCLSGFDQRHGAKFITEQLTRVFSLQNRKTLVVSFEAVPREGAMETKIESGSFWTLIKQDDNTDRLLVWEAALSSVTTEVWQALLHSKSQNYDQTLILNTAFTDSHTLPTMSISDLNLVCLDTRLTAAKLITEVDLLKEEYQLPNVHFAINRVGYTPSLLRELFVCMKNVVNRLMRNS